MVTFASQFAPRLLAGFGTLTLLAAIGLFASRPAHTAGGPVPVTVANTVQNRDTDSPARQPYVGFSDVNFNGSGLFQALTTVPAGKRLIIESITARYGILPVNTYSVLLVGTGSNECLAGLSLLPTADPRPLKTQMVRMTAEAGDVVYLQVLSNGVANNCQLTVSASGYYVDVP